MQIPEVVRQVFDAFPIWEHPPVKQLAPDTKQELDERVFNFSASKNSINDSRFFKIGCYNVFKHKESQSYLATDPMCLSIELKLGLDYHLKLPKEHFTHSYTTNRNSLFMLSYNAAKDGVLPILIEEGVDNKRKRAIKTFDDIQNEFFNGIESSTEIMLLTLVDTVIYDYWMTSLLFEFSEETQHQILYFDYQDTSKKIVNQLKFNTLLQQLVRRNGFNLRNPAITRYVDSYRTLSGILHPKLGRAVNIERERNLKECKLAISSLLSILSSKKTKFFNGDQGPGYLDIKLAAYTVLFDEFYSGSIFSDSTQLESHSKDVLKYCL